MEYSCIHSKSGLWYVMESESIVWVTLSKSKARMRYRELTKEERSSQAKERTTSLAKIEQMAKTSREMNI